MQWKDCDFCNCWRMGHQAVNGAGECYTPEVEPVECTGDVESDAQACLDDPACLDDIETGAQSVVDALCP